MMPFYIEQYVQIIFFFSSKPFNTENDCAAILVGVMNPNVVFKFYSTAIKYLDHKFYKEENFSNGPSLITIRRRLSTFADDIETVFLDIKKMIDEGIKRNSLEMCGNREESNNLFSHEITFGTQAFLSWVGKYNFPIPDELQHCMYQEHPAKNEIKALITQICPELEKFYNGLVDEVKTVHNHGSIATLEQSALYDTALAFFDHEQSKYTFLKKTMIDHEEHFSQNSQRRRRIIGCILKKYLESLDISAPAMSDLHSLHNEIINQK